MGYTKFGINKTKGRYGHHHWTGLIRKDDTVTNGEITFCSVGKAIKARCHAMRIRRHCNELIAVLSSGHLTNKNVEKNQDRSLLRFFNIFNVLRLFCFVSNSSSFLHHLVLLTNVTASSSSFSASIVLSAKGIFG